MENYKCGIVYGRALKYATSIDLYHFTKFFTGKFRLIHISPDENRLKILTATKRIYMGFLIPLFKLPYLNMIIYDNDGFTDIALLKRMKNIPVILMWYDAFVNYAEARKNPFKPLSYLRYNNILRADGVVGLSDALVNQAKKIRESEQNIFYLPNGVDTLLFAPEKFDGKVIRHKYNTKDDTVIVGYLGRIGGNGDDFAEKHVA